MANPWEAYQSPAARGPWQAFAEAGDFDARFKGEDAAAPGNAPALKAGLEARATQMTTGAPTSTSQQLATEFTNIGPAASQGTTPNIDAHRGKLISTETFESDAGDILFRDPATGQVVTTDKNKHVAIRDPKDGTVKIFARSAETNESPLVSGSRILATGLAAGPASVRLNAPVASAAQMRPGQAVADAASRIGVDVPRAVATDSMVAQRAAAVVRNVPGAGDPIVRATERTIKQVGQRADEVAQAYGSGSVQSSGDAASTGIKNWITGTSAQNATKLYDKVDDLVNPTVTTPLRNTQQAALRIQGLRDLAALPDESGALAQVGKALERGEGLTYEGLKTLRSSVGEMLDKKMLPANISEKELRSIYESLSLDLKAAVKNAGGDQALSAFERANRYFRLASERRDALAKIVGADGNQPAEAVFSRLVAMAGSTARADIVKLAQARKAMGAEDWNEFVSGIVANMGRNPTTRGAPEALDVSNFSPERFLSAYSKLSPQGRELLFRSTGKGDLARVLDDIATVSTRFKDLQKFSNPSGTGQTVLGGLGVAGLISNPLTTISAVVGGRALAHMLARPATASAVADWSRSYLRLARQPSAAAVANLNLASRNLLTNMGDKFGTFAPSDFLRAIQGPVRVPAEDEQQ
jgi:hypothetical protein